MKNLKDKLINESRNSWTIHVQNPFNGATYNKSESLTPKGDDYVCFILNNKEMVWLSKESLKTYCGYYDDKGDLQTKVEALKVGESVSYTHNGRDTYELLFVKLK